MPKQYVQKPGGDKVTLESLGYKDLEEAADAGGYSPVSAPVNPELDPRYRDVSAGGDMSYTAPVTPVSPAVDAVKAVTPLEDAFAMPAGYEKISGAKYPTGEAQKAAYGDIQTDPTGKFLYGKPTAPTVTPAADAVTAAEGIKSEKTVEEKIKEAKFALEREKSGTQSPEDETNLAYMRKQGWLPALEDTVSVEDETTAATIAADLGIPEIPSTADLITSVLSSTEYQYVKDFLETKGMFAEAGAEAAKEIIERKFETDKTALENNLAARGLTFSGIRGVAVRGLSASLASSTLDIDRKLAEKILDLDKGLMDTMIDMVGDLIDEANTGQANAIAQLNKAGFAVINGTLVPTMEARKEIRAVETAENKETRELIELNLKMEKAGLPNIKFEVANGRKVMITYDNYGTILETKDLGSAYKATGGGIIDVAIVDAYVARVRAGEITDAGVPSKYRDAVVLKLSQPVKTLEEYTAMRSEEYQMSFEPESLKEEYADYVTQAKVKAAGSYFSKTQIASGAKKAAKTEEFKDITIEAFGNLSIDVANQFIGSDEDDDWEDI